MELTMNMILTMKPEDFIGLMRTQTLGFCMSLQNLLKAQFEQSHIYKESLVRLLETKNVPKSDEKEIKDTLEQLYLILQLVEDRHTVLDLIIKEKRDIKH